jgi:hypothetical protein
MFHLLPDLSHPLKVLWRERIHLFWPIWVGTTTIGVFLVILVVPKKKSIPSNSIPSTRHNWSGGAILAVAFLVLLLACYIAGSLVWEDFTYYDNSHFTNGTLLGRNIAVQILPQNGRFFPLGHQEFNLIRHFTHSVVGYHALRIVQLVLLCGILLVFDEQLSVQARVALIILALITPSILISFSGLIYTEWNVIFWWVCLVWSVQRFEQTQFRTWAVAAVIFSQLMLYYKEIAFVLLLGFALGRLLLRFWKLDRADWDLDRLGGPNSRLDMCIALLGVWFLLYYLTAMFPNYSMNYTKELHLPLLGVLAFYFKLDLLVWVFTVAVLGRIIQILRHRAAPEVLWDAMALAGIGCFAAYLTLHMYSGYFLAPVDFIAVLYLGRLAALSVKDTGLATKLCVLGLLTLVVLQDFSFSAFRMYERKNIIHAKAEMGRVIQASYESDPRNVKRLFFPFATPFGVMEFASYISYLGVPVQETPPGSFAANSVMLVGRAFQTDGPCGYRTFACHPGSRPDPGDLVVLFPDDFARGDEWNSYLQEGNGPLFSYQARPSIPRWIVPYANCLHLVSPAFSNRRLPDRWLNGSVIIWK